MSEQVTDTGFVRVCRLDELPAVGAALGRDRGPPGHDRAHRRRRRALRRRHLHATPTSPLSEGELDGCTLECWLHGSRFDLRTGEPTGPPAIVPIAVHTFHIQHYHIYILGSAGSTSCRPSAPPWPRSRAAG